MLSINKLQGYRLHTITTVNGGSKGLGGGDRIQATMVLRKFYKNSPSLLENISIQEATYEKLLSTSAILLSATLLVACSNNQSTTKDSSEQTKNGAKKILLQQTQKPKQIIVEYDDLISEIKSKLDPESTGAISVKIQNNVIDSDSSEPHDTIMILLTGTAKDSAKETMDAIQFKFCYN